MKIGIPEFDYTKIKIMPNVSDAADKTTAVMNLEAACARTVFASCYPNQIGTFYFSPHANCICCYCNHQLIIIIIVLMICQHSFLLLSPEQRNQGWMRRCIEKNMNAICNQITSDIIFMVYVYWRVRICFFSFSLSVHCNTVNTFVTFEIWNLQFFSEKINV